jgi:hypothetical protein
MWDPASSLFSHKITIDSAGQWANQGSNALYSAISLIGLLEYHGAEVDKRQDLVRQTLDALHSVRAARPDFALIGCLMWCDALLGDERILALLTDVEQSTDFGSASSMEIGLLLAGLAKAHERFSTLQTRIACALTPLRAELLDRFVPGASLFRGTRSGLSVVNTLNGKLTSFASQVYPIHGLVGVARCTETPLPPEARAAAEQIVERQGALGQWWWQYSTKTGEVIEGYPVYSVHQDGMAFMALAALHNLGEGTYRQPLALGLRWLYGENELGKALIRYEPDMIFRCIQRKGSDPDALAGISRRNRIQAMLASHDLRTSGGTRADPEALEVLQECRSYHLGWALYAASLVRDWPESSPSGCTSSVDPPPPCSN